MSNNYLDIISIVAPIGIFFGRVANFINGELVGKTTDVFWGVIFPNIDNNISELLFAEGLISKPVRDPAYTSATLSVNHYYYILINFHHLQNILPMFYYIDLFPQ